MFGCRVKQTPKSKNSKPAWRARRRRGRVPVLLMLTESESLRTLRTYGSDYADLRKPIRTEIPIVRTFSLNRNASRFGGSLSHSSASASNKIDCHENRPNPVAHGPSRRSPDRAAFQPASNPPILRNPLIFPEFSRTKHEAKLKIQP
jgi:hypothetical protein